MKVVSPTVFLIACPVIPLLASSSGVTERALVLSFPLESGLPQKILALVASLVYADILDRRLYLADKASLEYFKIEKYAGILPAPQVPSLAFFSCQSEPDVEVLHIATDEYFVPALYLNPQYSPKLLKKYPHFPIFKDIIRPLINQEHPVVLLLKPKYQQIVEFYNSDDVIGVILEKSDSFWLDVKHLHRCVPKKIIQVISYQNQFHHLLQEHYPRLLFSDTRQDDNLFFDLLFQATYAKALYGFHNSATAQLVQAMNGSPMVLVKSFDSEASLCPRNSNPEPCYPHPLKQFYHQCAEKLQIEYNPYDLPPSLPFVENCREQKDGFKLKIN